MLLYFLSFLTETLTLRKAEMGQNSPLQFAVTDISWSTSLLTVYISKKNTKLILDQTYIVFVYYI